jgi:hypothetical protein
VSFAAITLCVVSQQVFIAAVCFVMTQSGNFWIYPRKIKSEAKIECEAVYSLVQQKDTGKL